MKTKKEILKWWIYLGGFIDKHNDWKEFKKLIALPYTIDHASNDRNRAHKITITSKRWKYPLKLYFFKDECYQIKGF